MFKGKLREKLERKVKTECQRQMVPKKQSEIEGESEGR